MALTPDQVDDLVTLTLNRFKRQKWTDISLDLQEYLTTQIMKQSVVERGGPKIDFKLQTRNTGNARQSGLFAVDNTAVDDLMITGTVPWSKVTTSYAYDIDEDLFQSQTETIIRELQARDHASMNDLTELMEEQLWGEPTSPSDTAPYGIPYWIIKSSASEGFNDSTTAVGDLDPAGIDATTYTGWRNWAFTYTNVSTTDFVDKVKRAMYKCKFRAPNPHPELGYGNAEAWHFYTTYEVRTKLERIAEGRNDNHGMDVARYVNKVVINGVPVDAVPYLDANDSSDPIYGINWRVFKPFVKSGANGRRTGPFRSAKQHTMREVHVDTWYNFCCVNRRAQFVGYVA